MPKKYPPLTFREVVGILKARELTFDHTRGSHHYYAGVWKGKRRMVTVDHIASTYGDDLIKMMIRQSGMSREEFYGSTRRTAKKINLR